LNIPGVLVGEVQTVPLTRYDIVDVDGEGVLRCID